MRRSKKEVAAAVERVEAVACTNIGDALRELTLRPNDLRRLVDAIDDARDSGVRQRAEIRRLRAELREVKSAAREFIDAAGATDVAGPAEVRLSDLVALRPPKKGKR